MSSNQKYTETHLLKKKIISLRLSVSRYAKLVQMNDYILNIYIFKTFIQIIINFT